MKKIILLSTLLISTLSFAETRQLVCQKPVGGVSAEIDATLDNSNLDKDSGYFAITQASFAFQYSSANLICSTSVISTTDEEVFNCIGYTHREGLIEATVNLKKGKGKAKLHNIGNNFYNEQTEGLELACEVSKSLSDK